MFYGVLGTTNKSKRPFTEVYVFEGKKLLNYIENISEKHSKKVSSFDNF